MWFLERWLENPATVKKLTYILYTSLVIVCLLGIVVQFAPSPEHEDHTGHDAQDMEHAGHEEHEPFVFESIPIFYAIFGLVICALLGLGAKAYGHNVVMKEEDYYDR
ncbi:MAG: hypothetical protein ACNYWM_02115 [Methanosarcinales archaeon]